MLYAIILHLLVGVVTGTTFKVRTLLLILSLVTVEFAILTVAQGLTAFVWGMASLLAIQIGYVAGIFTRGVLEHAGYSQSPIGKRRIF